MTPLFQIKMSDYSNYDVFLHFTKEGTTKLRTIIGNLSKKIQSTKVICNIPNQQQSTVDFHVIPFSCASLDFFENVDKVHSGEFDAFKINITKEDCHVFHVNVDHCLRTFCFGNDVWRAIHVKDEVYLKLYKDPLTGAPSFE